MEGNYIVFDTETTGLPTRFGSNYYYLNNYNGARLIQISWALFNKDHELQYSKNRYVLPNNFSINNSSFHGITNEIAKEKGELVDVVLSDFITDLSNAKYIICHNVDFDCNIIKSELYRICSNRTICDNVFKKCKLVCTLRAAFNMKKDKIITKANLGSVYSHFFNEEINGAHDALYDALNTAKIFKEMMICGYINPNK